jgi:hypothetical protein
MQEKRINPTAVISITAVLIMRMNKANNKMQKSSIPAN